MTKNKKTSNTKAAPKNRLNLYSLEKQMYNLHELNKGLIFDVKKLKELEGYQLKETIREIINKEYKEDVTIVKKMLSKKLEEYNNLPWYTRWIKWAREMGYVFFNPKSVVKLTMFRLFIDNKY